MFYGSVHVDPAAGWFPHTVGHADEIDDTSTNRNVPLAPVRAMSAGWPRARRCWPTSARFEPDAVVVSLGVDAAADDPNSPLLVSDVGFNAVGRRIAELDRATVLVQEGGYVLRSLAGHTLAVLRGFQS